MKRLVLGLLALVLLSVPLVAVAQSAGRVYRIGLLSPGRPPSAADSESFWSPLRERGRVEGQNILFEQRYAEGNYDRFPALAAEQHEDREGPRPHDPAVGAAGG